MIAPCCLIPVPQHVAHGVAVVLIYVNLFGYVDGFFDHRSNVGEQGIDG